MRTAAIISAVSVAAVLAGCTTNTTGAPTPTTPSSGDPIPTVENPRDLTAVRDRPCELLTPDQLTALRISVPGRPDTVGSGATEVPGCVWTDRNSDREIAVWTDSGIDVLGNVYAQRDTFYTFELIDIDGHPAIVNNRSADSISCLIYLEIAESQVVSADFTSLGAGLEQPCGPVRDVAAAVLANLPPAT